MLLKPYINGIDVNVYLLEILFTTLWCSVLSERRLLMIPGPISFEPRVLRELSTQNIGHMALEFTEAFSKVLRDLRELVRVSLEYQPLVLAGSGTLAMEASVSNFVSEDSRVLVVSSGVFGRRFVELFSKYPVEVDVLESKPGEIVGVEEVKSKLESGDYDVLTVTHVDTSTSIRYPIEELGKYTRDKNVLLVVDGVCSVGGEDVQMENWGIDVLLTGSQKAIGVPPGLAILWLSPKALERLEETKGRYAPYYMDFTKWIPVMKSYEERKPRYFATPAVNLILALRVSLEKILEEGLDRVFKRHRVIAEAFRSAMKSLGLELLAREEKYAASTVTSVKLPEDINVKEFLAEMRKRQVIVAGGLIPRINYFRVGHMGPVNSNDIIATIAAIERSLAALKFKLEFGVGVREAQSVLAREGF